MFRAVSMMKIQAIVLARDERAVLNDLGHLGVIHLTRAPFDPDTVHLTFADNSSELARYDLIRSRVLELRKALDIHSPPKESAEISGSDTEQEGKTQLPVPEGAAGIQLIDERLRLLEQQSAKLLGNYQRIIQRQKEIVTISEQVSPYRGLEIPLDGLDRFSFIHFVTGSIPAENLKDLEKVISDNVALLPLAQQKGKQSIFAITTRNGQSVLEEALRKTGFQHEVLPVAEGITADRLSEETEGEQNQLAAELEQVNNELRTIAARLALPLAEIERFIDTECRLLDISQMFSRTEATILISGWVPEEDIEVLERCLKEITSSRFMLKTNPPDALKHEQVPVRLRHSRLIKPFEMLVSTYGFPSYEELEPTLFVALSYIVMFGMMFGDVGHGMVLAICGLLALFIGRSRTIRDLGVLLLFGGASSIIFGVIYGSYFGIVALKKYALWHDPLEGDPMGLMYGAIGIGVVMISLGLILNSINRFRRGDVIGGFLDKFGLVGLLFYWGTLVLLMNSAAIQSRGLMGVSVVLFFVVPVVGWSFKEPIEHILNHGKGENGKKNGRLIGVFMESCVGAFEAILSYLANTISFVRLAAYAMSHAALLFAAFMLAEEVKKISFGGTLWSLLIIILGNLIAIVLEGIIASVQALRLEYYEFFGKFFSGSGQPFEPFKLTSNGKNIRIYE